MLLFIQQKLIVCNNVYSNLLTYIFKNVISRKRELRQYEDGEEIWSKFQNQRSKVSLSRYTDMQVLLKQH